jgi:hypothetical protein
MSHRPHSVFAMSPRRPFVQRNDPESWDSYDGPHDGVPTWLAPSLIGWVVDGLFESYSSSEAIEGLSLWVRRPLPSDYRQFRAVLWKSTELVLNATDYVLMTTRVPQLVVRLQAILDQAGSLYTVGRDESDTWELQERVSPETMELGSEAMAGDGRSAEHLRAAWSKTFGRDKDPTSAYDHSIKAVEIAARPIITPIDDRATLGKMIRAMEDKPSKWTTSIDCDGDVDRLVAMMRLLWEGHYRHGDESKPFSNTPESATAAVQLAVVLTQWFKNETVHGAP